MPLRNFANFKVMSRQRKEVRVAPKARCPRRRRSRLGTMCGGRKVQGVPQNRHHLFCVSVWSPGMSKPGVINFFKHMAQLMNKHRVRGPTTVQPRHCGHYCTCTKNAENIRKVMMRKVATSRKSKIQNRLWKTRPIQFVLDHSIYL